MSEKPRIKEWQYPNSEGMCPLCKDPCSPRSCDGSVWAYIQCQLPLPKSEIYEGACGSAPRLATAEVASTPSTPGWLTSGGYPYPLTVNREQPRGIPCGSASRYTESPSRVSTIISNTTEALVGLLCPQYKQGRRGQINVSSIPPPPNSLHSLGRRLLSTKLSESTFPR